MGARRLLPLSGVVFVVFILISVVGLQGDTPENHASGAEVAAFYNGQDIRQALAAVLFAASIPFLVFFAVSVATAGRMADAQRVWEHVFIGGSVLTGATLAMLSAVHFALPDGATNHASPAALQALNLIDADGWVAFNSGLGVMMLGAAGCLLTRPRPWLGWIALALGVLLFIPFADFFALILTLLWILVVSVMQFRNTSEGHTATATEVPLL
jgi:hypothetical protein